MFKPFEVVVIGRTPGTRASKIADRHATVLGVSEPEVRGGEFFYAVMIEGESETRMLAERTMTTRADSTGARSSIRVSPSG
jgi:hypothetical protein